MARKNVWPIRLDKEEMDLITDAAIKDQRTIADFIRIGAKERAIAIMKKSAKPAKKGKQ